MKLAYITLVTLAPITIFGASDSHLNTTFIDSISSSDHGMVHEIRLTPSSAQEELRNSALTHVLKTGHKADFFSLLAQSTDVHNVTIDMMPLLHGVLKYKPSWLKPLLKQSFNLSLTVQNPYDKNRTLLQTAIYRRKWSAVEFLLSFSAATIGLDVSDLDGRTALDYVVMRPLLLPKSYAEAIMAGNIRSIKLQKYNDEPTAYDADALKYQTVCLMVINAYKEAQRSVSRRVESKKKGCCVIL